MFRKPTGKKPTRRPASPLDRRQQALREREEKLLKEKERAERMVREAPLIKQEQARRRREEIERNPSLLRHTMVDQHAYHVSTLANPGLGRRKLRQEKQDGFWLFLLLASILGVIVVYIFKLLVLV